MISLRSFLLVFILSYCTFTFGQAPANDNCASATTLTVGASCTSGTTANATIQGSEAVAWCGSAPSQSVWYNFVATATVMDVWVRNTKSVNSCELASAVWNTGTCLPSGTPTWYKAIGSPTDVWHHLTGLTISNTYLIQICYRTTGGGCGGAGGSQTFCVGVYAPTTTSGYDMPTTSLEVGVSLGACVVMTSGAQFYDDGGSASNHGNSYTGLFRVFCPASVGKCMRATLNYVNMTPSNDYLRIVNSSCRNGSIYTDYSMASPGTQYTSTDSSGCLAFRIWADASTNRAGWNITLAEVACSVGPNGTDPNDAVNAIPICAASTYSGNSTGPGLTVETCGTCDLSENHSVWYKFKIATGGMLQFTVNPLDNGDDYDFVLFGPTTNPAALGSARRCSYAYDASNGNTGLRPSETDNSENSSGNGWVDTMTVKTGETYYLFMNRTDDDADPQPDGWTIDFTSSTCTFDCSITLPIQLVSFDAVLDATNQGVSINWITETEMNNDFFSVERSDNGVDFYELMEVDGAGTSMTSNYYYSFDPYPFPGISYYRLKQTDFDGTVTYSPIKSVITETTTVQVTIAPNPVGEQLNFTLISPDLQVVPIRILNMQGKEVFSAQMDAHEGVNEFATPVSILDPGFYTLICSTRSDCVVRKFIKH